MTQEQALQLLKTGANVFLTGEPGAGKTHTVNEYVRYLRRFGIEPAITASTGIAATHLGGMTIHSWSGIGVRPKLTKADMDQIKSNPYIKKRITKASVLIIDEVSMLSADMVNMVEVVCRKVRDKDAPFGGLQVVFVGDFFQLPPVIRHVVKDEAEQGEFFEEEEKPIFSYGASAWQRARPVVCYLTEQHRQSDVDFLELLSSIRRNAFSEKHLQCVQTRKVVPASVPSDITKLYSHNVDVDRVNDRMLRLLPGEQCTFEMRSAGRDSIVEAMKRSCLSPEMLHLREGAVVMFTKNSMKDGFVNGTLGTVVGFEEEHGLPIVETRGGRYITVTPMEWMVEENGKIRARLEQLPLRLAWAMTVHKSQGMSLDAAVMDLSSVFEYGQGYVALSRVRTLEGLHLLGWNERTFEVHPAILEQDEVFRQEAEQATSEYASMSPDILKQKQEEFLRSAGGNPKVLVKKKVKTDTHTETLLLWKQGKSITEIAETRELKENTVMGHLEKLIEEKAMERAEVMRAFSPDLKNALMKICSAFRELETKQLSPVFEKFDGVYSYDDLRLVRMFLDD